MIIVDRVRKRLLSDLKKLNVKYNLNAKLLFLDSLGVTEQFGDYLCEYTMFVPYSCDVEFVPQVVINLDVLDKVVSSVIEKGLIVEFYSIDLLHEIGHCLVYMDLIKTYGTDCVYDIYKEYLTDLDEFTGDDALYPCLYKFYDINMERLANEAVDMDIDKLVELDALILTALN